MSANYAPIAFFAFNRPNHTKISLAALSENPESINSDLLIFIDGPRNSEDNNLVKQVSEIAKNASGFNKIIIHESLTNKGLYSSITEGVSKALETYDRVIVIEDDILVSPFFLAYMNQGLQLYSLDLSVGSIHAYSPPINELPDYYFVLGGDCWGWATWKSRWATFEPNCNLLIKNLVQSGKLQAFTLNYGTQVLRHLIRRGMNLNQSWASQWNASLYLQSLLTLHPGKSFVENIGNDGTGFHSKSTNLYKTNLITEFSSMPRLPLIHNIDAASKLRFFYNHKNTISIFNNYLSILQLLWLKLLANLITLKFH